MKPASTNARGRRRKSSAVRDLARLEEELLGEQSRARADRIAASVCMDPKRVKRLMAIFLTGDRLAAQRAAWIVGICAEREITLIQPYLARMVRRMQEPEVHDAVRRCVVRILQCAEIPSSLMGTVATICFDYLADPEMPTAVRVYAMSVLDRIARREPALREELNLVIEQQLPFAGAGFHARAREILRRQRTSAATP